MTDPLVKDLADLAEAARVGGYTDDQATIMRGVERLAEYKRTIRTLCEETAARQVLSLEAAEAIFSEPRSDH